ncbi:MAG: SH3 domain-containing protein [Anaerolineales bacterium]|nr:SH3 domain-containing protein [Anaerolineales bacterium]
MKKHFALSVLILSTAFFIISCLGTTAVPTPDRLATIVATTLTAVAVNAPPVQLASATPETMASSTPAVAPTAEILLPRYVYTQSMNVNLRVNPGRLFKVSRVLPEGTKLQTIGIAHGGGWLNVVNDEGIVGWVGVDFVSSGFDEPPLPLVAPKDVQMVTGKVVDENNNPVTGVGFAVMQNDQREDAHTDINGMFYAYLPLKFSGAWTVEFVSVNCKSNTMDANCKCLGGACGKPYPQSYSITLPMSAPLSFVWR